MYNDTKALKEELLEIGGYDKTTRPRLYQREQVDIMMLFGLYSIYGINEVTESFTTCGYMSISWYDDLLTWDPESHRNQTFIELPQRQVWTPEISLTNAVEFNEPMGSDDSLMIVQSDGYVRRWTFQVYTATCSLDITYYPFDEHDCTLDFSVIGYGYNEVNVNSTASYTYMDYFTLNSEWEVAQKGVKESGDDRGDPNLSFKFHFKRRPGYVLMTSVMPSSCRKGRNSVKGYFLAGRNIHWLPIGFSLFASNIGSEHFIGLAGSGAKSGIAVAAFEWGVDLYAGSIFIQQALGWNIYISISAIVVITAIYTIIGGLSAVIFTDTLQTVIMLVGSVILAILAYIKVGGLWALEYKYPYAIPQSYDPSTNDTCGLPRDDAFIILRDSVTADLPWPGVLIRSTIASLWYWCTDQVIVQRTLAARNVGHARGGTIIAGYLKLTVLFSIIIPGMISRVLYPDEVGCIDPEVCKSVCDNENGCSNIAYPKLVLELAPIGLKGLMMAVMMSALMSSLTSIFNSAATLFTMDIWKKIRKDASERELLISGRLFVAVLVGVSIAWIPLIKSSQEGQLFVYIQAVTGYIATPLSSIFLLAVLVPRINEEGAFWGLLIGQLAGVVRLVLDFIYPSPACGEPDMRPAIISDLNFTYFSAISIVLSALVAVVLSFCTSKPDYDKIKGLTVWSVHKLGISRSSISSRRKTIINKYADNAVNLYRQSSTIESQRMSSISKTIHRENNIEDVVTMETELQKRYKEAMNISSGVGLFLNFNAILLLCVLVICYAIFGM
ncbi:hypothetical protein ACF0H5_010813 [Mactra antiquata]